MITNKYIKSILTDFEDGYRIRNSSVDIIDKHLTNINFKIITGVSDAIIPILHSITPKEAQQLKYEEVTKLVNRLNSLVNFGFSKNDAIRKELHNSFETGYDTLSQVDFEDLPNMFSVDELMKFRLINFKHPATNFILRDNTVDFEYQLENQPLLINYDIDAFGVLGMNIISKWSFQMGPMLSKGSSRLGQSIFLACPHGKENNEYYAEMGKLYGNIFK